MGDGCKDGIGDDDDAMMLVVIVVVAQSFLATRMRSVEMLDLFIIMLIIARFFFNVFLMNDSCRYLNTCCVYLFPGMAGSTGTLAWSINLFTAEFGQSISSEIVSG